MTRSTLLALSLLCLSLVSNKARAEGDTNVQAQPNAVGNSSIINQNMNVNNGMTGKLQFGNLICSQPTMAVTPFYTGNDAQGCLLYTSPSPRDVEESRMPSSA